MSRIPAGVIAGEVGVDHERNIRWRYPDLLQTILEHGRAVRALVLDPVNILELFALFVARTRIDEDETRRMLDYQPRHPELYPVRRVGGDAPLPERFRNHAEHGAAVEPLAACLNRVNRKAADLAALNERTRCCHAVVSRVTGVGNPDALRFFRRPAGVRSNVCSSPQVPHPRSARSDIIRIRHLAVASASPPARWRLRIST